MRRYLDWGRTATRSEYWGVLIIGWILAAVLSIVTIAVMILDGLFVLLGGLIMLAGFIVLIWAMLATTAVVFTTVRPPASASSAATTGGSGSAAAGYAAGSPSISLSEPRGSMPLARTRLTAAA